MEESKSSSLSVGLANFYYWYETRNCRLKLEGVLRQLLETQLIDGVEFHVASDRFSEAPRKAMSVFDSFEDSLVEQLLCLPKTSMHLPPLVTLGAKEVQACVAWMHSCAAVYGIREFTVHPDRSGPMHWEVLLSNLSPEIRVSVENMDFRKKDYQSLVQLGNLLQQFPQLWVTIDVCHWLELGYSFQGNEFTTFLQRFGTRVSKLHYSVFENPRQEYDSYRHLTPHFCVTGSNHQVDLSFLSSCPRLQSIVLEGLIPVDGESLLLEELRYVTQNLQLLS